MTAPKDPNPPPKPLLLWDGECGFCARWIGRWRRLTGGAVEYLPYQESEEYTATIGEEALAQAVHLVEPDGRVTRGAEAVVTVLACSPWRMPHLFAWMYRNLPGMSAVMEWAYRWVARNRGRL